MPQQPARIVLIEDNPSDVMLLRHALDAQKFDYRLEVIEDGEKAMRFVLEQCSIFDPDAPCVVVLDLHLPKYDGLEVLTTMRREPALAHVKVVALTGAATPREQAELNALGVRLYRSKPHDLDEVMRLGAEIVSVCREHVLTATV